MTTDAESTDPEDETTPATAELARSDDLEPTPHATVFDSDGPRTVKLHLAADERVPEHRHPGETVVLYLVVGRLELSIGDATYELTEGDAMRFSGDQDISPRASEASEALLVFTDRAGD